MAERTLRRCRILVVEDDYMLADDLRRELDEAGAIVLGPVGTVEDALKAIDTEPRIDGALLDVNLGGEMAFPAGDLLVRRRVPFAFTTGYDDDVIPSRFAHVPLCQKPVSLIKVVSAIGRALEK